jgi:hypothetical protein
MGGVPDADAVRRGTVVLLGRTPRVAFRTILGHGFSEVSSQLIIEEMEIPICHICPVNLQNIAINP